MSTFGRIARLAGQWIPAALARPFGAPTAVFFHGVEPRLDNPAIQRHSQHSVEAFETIARLLRREFEVLPLRALSDVLKHPEKHSRAVFLMSDDGYANTMTAADVLEAHDLPWTLFVSTHHIDTGEFTPPTLARIFFLEAPDGTYDIPHLEPVTLAGREEREALAEKLWPRLKKLDAARGNEALAAMRKHLGDPAARFPSERFLHWDQVRALHKRGVEIGAHADTHWAMHDGQSQDYLGQQARHPKERIEQEVGACRFFAYPFGQRSDVGGAAWQAVRDAGYDYAFTTLAGTLDASTNPWLMPRYGLEQRESHLASFLPVLRANNVRLKTWQSQIGT